jgi:hypothetical protein
LVGEMEGEGDGDRKRCYDVDEAATRCSTTG